MHLISMYSCASLLACSHLFSVWFSVRLLTCTMQGTHIPNGRNLSSKPERGELTLGMPTSPNNKSSAYLLRNIPHQAANLRQLFSQRGSIIYRSIFCQHLETTQNSEDAVVRFYLNSMSFQTRLAYFLKILSNVSGHSGVRTKRVIRRPCTERVEIRCWGLTKREHRLVHGLQCLATPLTR